MISDYKPILINTNPDFDNIEVYFVHDVHYGSDNADIQRWERVKKDIKAKENRFVVFAGDYCETAIINSKSDVYSQNQNLECQRMWMEQQFCDLKDRILCIVPGNHENRVTKAVGLFPVYDAAVCAGVQDKYRQHFAFVDIGVGCINQNKGKQQHYVGFVTHRLKDCKNYHGSDFIEGIDFAAYGHDHDPKDHARGKIVYDPHNKMILSRDVEVIDSGSFLTWGGYGVDSGYRPQASKLYKIVLNGGQRKGIQTVGYHI